MKAAFPLGKTGFFHSFLGSLQELPGLDIKVETKHSICLLAKKYYKKHHILWGESNDNNVDLFPLPSFLVPC